MNVDIADGKPTVITVYNNSGQVVLRKNASQSTIVSLAGQPEGIYFLSVSQDKAVTTEKITKQ